MGRGERSSADKGTVHWEQLDIQSVFNVNVYKEELVDKTQKGGVLVQEVHLLCKNKLKINWNGKNTKLNQRHENVDAAIRLL